MESKKCLICDSTFYKKETCSKKRWEVRTKYCSLDCRRKSMKGFIPWNKGLSVHLNPKNEFKKGNIPWTKGKKFPELSGENSPNWKPKIIIPCSHCKKELSLQSNQVKNRNFCNRICWALGTRGKDSPVFNEKAVSNLRNRIMQFAEYKEWRLQVLRRDDFTCQVCMWRNKGLARRPLEVDHIKRFYTLMIEYKIQDTKQARECLPLWDIDNGRTLCRECHRKSETYGKRGLKKER